jgi:hypothetical protein
MRVTFIFIVCFILISATLGIAQSSNQPDSAALKYAWSKSMDINLTMTENSYSDSWAGGEAGNVSWVSNANGVFEKQVSPIFKFKNTTKLSFGQTHIQDKTTKKWAKPIKSTDLIDIENLGLLTIKSFIEPYAALRLETEFYDASVTSIRRYFSPAKITESAGGARTIYKANKNELLTRLGFAFRQIITSQITDTLAKNTKTETTNDGGFESVTDFKYTLSQNLSLTSKLDIYKAIFYSKSKSLKGTPEANYWQMADVNWENRLSASVAKYVTVSFYTQLLYDKEISLKGRFKQTLALGLTYKMF